MSKDARDAMNGHKELKITTRYVQYVYRHTSPILRYHLTRNSPHGARPAPPGHTCMGHGSIQVGPLCPNFNYRAYALALLLFGIACRQRQTSRSDCCCAQLLLDRALCDLHLSSDKVAAQRLSRREAGRLFAPVRASRSR